MSRACTAEGNNLLDGNDHSQWWGLLRGLMGGTHDIATLYELPHSTANTSNGALRDSESPGYLFQVT